MHRLAYCVALSGVMVAWLIAAGGARAVGVDETCELTATRFDPDTINVLFPDQSAQYWSARYTAIPGTRIRIDGTFPYARYTSWNVYDQLLRPIAKASDFQLQPDPGSANPFIAGASRTTPTAQRHYTLYITFSATDKPGPNVIFVDPTKNPTGLFTLRVYVPDAGRDISGGVGLPQVSWEPTGAGGALLASPCQTLEKPSSNMVTSTYAGQSGPDAGAPFPGRNPPVWRRFVNLCQSGSDLLFDDAFGDQLPPAGSNPCDNFGSGGFLSNSDNAYVSAFISRGFGRIVVFHGRAPTFAATYPNAATMPGGVQVRYWSFCQNDPIDQRYVACRRDDQAKLDAKGNYTVVLSPPSAWPTAAARRCKRTASWIPWGPQPDGVVIYRQMLAAAGFTQAIQNVSHGSEQKQMGPYYPGGRYFANWQAVAKAEC